MAAFFFLQKMKKDVIVNFADTERKRKKQKNNSPLRKTLLKSNPWFAKKSILELCNKRKQLYNWQEYLWHKKINSVIFTLLKKLYEIQSQERPSLWPWRSHREFRLCYFCYLFSTSIKYKNNKYTKGIKLKEWAVWREETKESKI